MEAGKRLMRDPSKRVVGGVCAGVANYVGGSITAWRLLALLLAVSFTLPVLVTYLICWIAIPEDRSAVPRGRSGCAVALLVVLVAAPLCMLLLPLVVTILMGLGLIGWTVHTSLWDSIEANALAMLQPEGVMLWVYVACAVAMVVLITILVSRYTRGERDNLWRIVVLIVLIPLVVLMAVWGTATVRAMKDWVQQVESDAAEWTQRAQEEAEAAAAPDYAEKEYLRSWGWNIIACNSEHATASGEYYDGTADYRYLEGVGPSTTGGVKEGALLYTAERCDSTLQEGTYRLHAVARAGGRGACIYVRIGASAAAVDAEPLFERSVPIPAHADKGGSVPGWNGDARGWTQVSINDIPLKAGATIYYGITTDPRLTHGEAMNTWFSVCDFELIRD